MGGGGVSRSQIQKSHVQIHLGMDIRQTICPWRHKGALGGGGGRWSQIKMSGEAVKRLDRLAPTLVHVCGFIWEWINRLNTTRPSIPQRAFRGGGLGGQKFKSLGKLSNGWTDWHLIRYMSADSSGNGHNIYAKYYSPLNNPGGISRV